VAAGVDCGRVWIPLLHPLHASSSGDHIWLWGVVGAGAGLAVVIGARIVASFLRADDED